MCEKDPCDSVGVHVRSSSSPSPPPNLPSTPTVRGRACIHVSFFLVRLCMSDGDDGGCDDDVSDGDYNTLIFEHQHI